MKIRYGFVSNSSSSSFIIAYNNKTNLYEQLIDQLNKKGYGDQSKIIQRHFLSRANSTYDINNMDNWDKMTLNNFLEEIPYILRSVILTNDLDNHLDYVEDYIDESSDTDINSIILNVIKSLCKAYNITTILYGTMEDCSINPLDLELVNTRIQIIEPDIKLYNDPRS